MDPMLKTRIHLVDRAENVTMTETTVGEQLPRVWNVRNEDGDFLGYLIHNEDQQFEARVRNGAIYAPYSSSREALAVMITVAAA